MALVCVKITGKQVYIEMSQESKAGTSNDENPGLTCKDAPMDSLQDALQAFGERAHSLNELADDDWRWITVRAVRVYRKKSGKSFEIEYERILRRTESGSRVLPEKTLRYEPTAADSVLLTNLAAEAERYVAGERTQLTLGLVDGEEEGEEAAEEEEEA